MFNPCFTHAEAEKRLHQLLKYIGSSEVMANRKKDSLILIKQGAEAVGCYVYSMFHDVLFFIWHSVRRRRLCIFSVFLYMEPALFIFFFLYSAFLNQNLWEGSPQ